MKDFNKRNYLLISFLLYLLTPTYLLSQTTEQLQKKFDSLYFVVHTNSNDIQKHGQYLLSISQTDLQKARSYNIIGDGLYKQGRYLEAVEQLEKGNQYAIKAQNDYWRMYIVNLLIRTYKYAGLHSKANEYIDVLHNLKVENTTDKKLAIIQVKALMLEIDKKYCEAAVYRGLSTNETVKVLEQQPLEYSKNYIIPSRSLYMYDLVKCGKFEEAKKQLDKVEELLKVTQTNGKFNMKSYYLLTKAHLNIHNGGDLTITKQYLESAYQDVLHTSTTSWIKTVIDDILSTKILSDQEDKKYYAKLIELGENKIYEQSQLTDRVIINTEQELSQNKNSKNNIIILLIIVIVVSTGGLILNQRRNKRIKKAFEKIQNELREQKKSPIEISKDTADSKERIISSELETEILKNLKHFETKLQFLSKDISSSNMASRLKTTPRNLSYILKKHRKNDFNNYINEVRINYIIEQLNSDKKLRNYKIAALADICGYKSHSQFTIAFKNRKDISPSQYIEMINKNEQKNEPI